MAKESVRSRLDPLKDRSTLQLTTFGRKTGKPHKVTVWFLVDGDTVILVTLKLKRDWPRNVRKNGKVDLDIGGMVFKGRATQIAGAKQLARVNKLLGQKYWAAWLGSKVGMGPEGAFEVNVEA